METCTDNGLLKVNEIFSITEYFNLLYIGIKKSNDPFFRSSKSMLDWRTWLYRQWGDKETAETMCRIDLWTKRRILYQRVIFCSIWTLLIFKGSIFYLVFYSFSRCIVVNVEPPCTVEKGDLSKPYPDCCFEIKCPEKAKL